jgi:DNA-binding response OmpR family regulator
MTKILLIEDIPNNAELVRKALSRSGYEIIHAADAETGLQLALAHCPDLILLDLGLPDYDGQTLTAWPEETAKEMVESYGCNGYICKPITKVSKFVAQINSFLKTPNANY